MDGVDEFNRYFYAQSDVFSQASSPAQLEAMYRKYPNFQSYVKGGRVEPHWMTDGNSFWYAEGAPEPAANTRVP